MLSSSIHDAPLASGYSEYDTALQTEICFMYQVGLLTSSRNRSRRQVPIMENTGQAPVPKIWRARESDFGKKAVTDR